MSPAGSSGMHPQPAARQAGYDVLADVLRALWRLGPGNPIAARTVSIAGKRTRHFYVRLAYVGILLLVAGIGFMRVAGQQAGLADLAKANSQIFALVSFVQLLMMCLLAPIFAAGAIAQQRDAQTFNVLLTTPLTNGQIVLGTLFGRLFLVMALLISGLPIFLMTMLYGGVTSREILLSFGVAAAAGLLTASVAITIGMLGVGTRQGVLSFYVIIGLYLAGGIGLARFFPLSSALPGAPGMSPLGLGRMCVYAWAHPVLALAAALGMTPPPGYEAVAHLPRPLPMLLARPAEGFILVSTVFCAGLISLAILTVRQCTHEGEPTWYSRWLWRLIPIGPARKGASRRRARSVWRNPVAWREAVARASSLEQRIMRWLVFVAGTAAAIGLLIYWHTSSPVSKTQMRTLLATTLLIEAVVAMIAVVSAAGTAIARDRENGTQEILLTTPLSSRYILTGKLRGLITLVAPLLAIPTVTVALFVAYEAIPSSRTGGLLLSPVSVVVVPLTLLAHVAALAMIGLHISLRHSNTTKAVLISVAVAVGIYLPLTAACVGLGRGWSLFVGLNPFVTLLACVYTKDFIGMVLGTSGLGRHLWLLVTSALGAAAVLLAVWQGHRNMVKNFEMTLRRQT